ncbi:uncharacterized protein LOC114354540 [Ostrinia furnacalis]|uniref:uncharacterized protein LOC114354540 n=1 Tax=Ostrinia furnacalis TaxID=93504 RepID=UPI00103F4F25|nr:uncharacterized protein LOC114354540 [Ostrinia furnacalis]
MVLKKCLRCKKSITKKTPGLECSRCDVIVHADPACSKLSNKQLNTLKNSPGIEWSCEECLKNLSRRSSFITPDEDAEEEDSDDGPSRHQLIDADKLVEDISREVKKTFREEISGLETSLEYLSEQLTTMEQSIKKQDTRIKELENKNYDLINQNKNLELRVSVLEQGHRELEQKSLSSSLEVAGLPDISPSEVIALTETIASALNMEQNDVQSAQRMPGAKDKPGSIMVEMKSKTVQQKWIDAGKDKCITVGMLMPNAPKETADRRVFIREALTNILFKKATPINVHKIIKDLNSNKAPGLDNVTISDIKVIGEPISQTITNLINNSVKTGAYPDKLKEGCSGKGTHSLLSKFTDEVNSHLNEQRQVLALFIDFSRAFDTLKHDQLVDKLDRCGVRGPLLKWCQAYLRNRSFSVKLDNNYSTPLPVTEGTAQGSVLGPLHFLSYVNDMSGCIINSTCYQFADDTCLVIANKDPQIAGKLLQMDLDALIRWCHDAGLVLNANKTKLLIIKSPYIIHSTPTIELVATYYEHKHNYLQMPTNRQGR